MARRAAKIFVVENGGKSASSAIRKAGYGKSMSRNPQKLTKTKTWEDLMEEFMPESLISKVHNEQMSATKPVVIAGKVKMFPDNDARLKATDMGIKLRGKYAPDQITLTKRKYQDLSNTDLMALQNKLKDFLTKK